MQLEKQGKLNKINVNGFNCQFGTTNAIDGKCIYSVIGCWVKPLNGDLESEIKILKQKISNLVKDFTNQLFNDVIDRKMPKIIIVENSNTKFSNNTRRVNEIYSFVQIDITLYFNKKIDIRNKEINDSFYLLFLAICDLFQSCSNLKFNPKKLK